MEKLEEIESTLKKRLSEKDTTEIATKVVSRMVNVQTMQSWYEHVRESPIAESMDIESLDMTEEEEAIADAAKYMTLMNLFEEKEEYEKCAICKIKLSKINKILKRNE